jgi:phosphatidylglycerol:prolipoprotein diacylglycerol transferase
VVEFFREPDVHLGFQALGWVTRGQLLCLPMIALGLYLLWYAHHRAAGTSHVKDARP